MPPEITAEDLAGSLAEVAARFKVTPRTVSRWRTKLRISKGNAPTLTEDQKRWVQTTVAERMPMSWAAETLGCGVTNLRRQFRPGHDPEWHATWNYIRRHPHLLDLHHEIAPPSTKGK